MFDKILIANRGEIACRVIRTAQRLGIRSVAVFSDVDSTAQHVQLADEAIHIGGAAAVDSYLDADRVISAAALCGAQAIHPGYGFLSENAAFARACADSDIVFIGPSPEAIEAMGSKSAAKQIMERAGVPLVPGYHGEDQSEQRLRSAAEAMGYPVLLKASAGGGGKGMRQVHAAEEFSEALDSARREAKASFGDDHMLVEKYLTSPRHVEVQVFFDNSGNGVYLAERDCSVQRRHQKIIEEAPAPGLAGSLRKAMGEAALKSAAAIGYSNAGTVEFLLDEDGSFYFMEMNTRLQVEHPVTEMITGQDLVEWQLIVAGGGALPLQQPEIITHGHAFEARIYAEDPANDFLPSTGVLQYLVEPAPSENVRIDTGVVQGDEISVHYDPMIAKLITWDESRERALRRLATALGDYRIAGTKTNIEFLHKLASCDAFIAAELDTGFIAKYNAELFPAAQTPGLSTLAQAAVALLLKRDSAALPLNAMDEQSPWSSGTAWQMNQPNSHSVIFVCDGHEYCASIVQTAEQFEVTIAGTAGADDQAEVAAEPVYLFARADAQNIVFEYDGYRRSATLAEVSDGWVLFLDEHSMHIAERTPGVTDEDAAGGGNLSAPMNGTVTALLVDAGTTVDAGTPLLVLEAMKMEHTIKAVVAGTVDGFRFAVGDLVDGGAQLVDFSASDATSS